MNGTFRRTARALKPGMLIRSVVDNQFCDDPKPAGVSAVEERLEVVERSVDGVDRVVISDVVAIIAQGRRIEGHNPDRGHTEVGYVVELLRGANEITDTVR